MTNIRCQVTSDRLWPTSGGKSRVADYDQRQALSHNWQTMINVKNQSTSGRLWPTSNVKSLVTDYEKQCASGHEW